MNSVLLMLTVPDTDNQPATERLLRPYFGMHRLEWPDDDSVEFHLGLSRLSATVPKAVAGGLTEGLEMIAAAQIRPELTIVEPLESVAAIHDLLAAGLGSGKYLAKVHR